LAFDGEDVTAFLEFGVAPPAAAAAASSSAADKKAEILVDMMLDGQQRSMETCEYLHSPPSYITSLYGISNVVHPILLCFDLIYQLRVEIFLFLKRLTSTEAHRR